MVTDAITSTLVLVHYMGIDEYVHFKVSSECNLNHCPYLSFIIGKIIDPTIERVIVWLQAVPNGGGAIQEQAKLFHVPDS